MITSSTALVLSLVVPLLASVACVVLAKLPNLRDGLTFLATLVTFALVLQTLNGYLAGEELKIVLVTFAQGLDLSLNVEPLGLVVAPHIPDAIDVCHNPQTGSDKSKNQT